MARRGLSFWPNAGRSSVLELRQPLPPGLRLAPSFRGSSQRLLSQLRPPRRPLENKA